MSRQIRFRGRVSHHRPNKEGEWVYGFVVGKNYIVVGIDPTFIYKDKNIVLLQSYFPVDPATVGQYTGLKDKAGVESYKDDIYHLKDFTDEYIMLWDDTGAYFYLKGIHGGEVKPASMVSTGEKIGDKHSNPELIEK